MTATPLTARQAAFVNEYLVDLNATAAAIRAGYSPKTADVTASRVLHDPRIAAAIAAAVEARADRTKATADDVLQELFIVLRSDVRHFDVDDQGNPTLANGVPDSQWRSVSSIRHKIKLEKDGSVLRSVEFRLWDKIAAAKLVGEHLGIYTKKVEHSVTAGGGVLAVPIPIGAEQWGAIAAQQQAALTAKPPAG